MEQLRSHRQSSKSSFGHVFSASFPAKSDDYGEIFDEMATSCSIPFLDVSPSVESCEIGGLFGYSEIFGGFKGGDFAVDYEDLLKKEVESLDSSSGRVDMDAKFGQKEDGSDLFPEGAASCKDYGASSESNISSISNHSDDGSHQFSMLYHRTDSGSLEDAVSKKTHTAQLNAVSGHAYTIKSCSLKDLSSDNSLTSQSNELIYNITTNRRSTAVEQEKITSSSYSTENTHSYRADMKTNEMEEYSNKHAPLEDAFVNVKHSSHSSTSSTENTHSYSADMKTNETEKYSNKHVASEGAFVNVKHSSHSSTSYSASNGVVPYPNAPYVSISDVNLQTKPSRVAPPSKTPPKIVHKQEFIKMKMPRTSSGDQEGNLLKPPRNHQIRYKIGAPKSHGLQSSDFIDVEVDTGSAAAASVAAIKEAMEQAQARLKSAKKLMDIQQNNNERHKKPGHRYGTRYDERKDAKAFEEEKFREGAANKTVLKEDKEMKDHAFDDLQKVTEVGKTPPDHEESQTDAVVAAGSLQMRQGNGFKSSQMCFKPEELCGEWKTEEKFYELVNNEKLFNVVKEGKLVDAEKKFKTTTEVNEVKESYYEEDVLSYEFNKTARLHKVNTPVERDEIGDNSNACNMTSKEGMSMTPEKTRDTCTQDSLSSDYRDVNQKLQAAHEALGSREELKKPNTGKKASCGETEMIVQFCNNTIKIEEAYHDDDENKKLHAAKEPCEHDENDNKFKATYGTSISYESEEKLKMFRRTGVPENKMEGTSATYMGETEEELVAPGGTCQYENNEYTRGNNRHEFYHAENECKLETTSLVNVHGESGNLYRAPGEFISVENDFRSKVTQNGNEVRENSNELKTLREANKKKQNANCAPSVTEDSVKADVLRSDHTKSENGKFKDSIGAVGSDVTHNQFDAAQERAENKDIGGVQQGSRAENEDLREAAQEVCLKSRSSSPDTVGTLGTVVTENSNPDVDKKGILERATSIEREHGKEQARKATEEREKVRQRDNDRLAVERATHEAHKRALSEARERAERIAVERAATEARQRSLTEARGKAQKASTEVLEKSLLEKALKEAKLRAGRAAVERATAEARERAVEKAIAEKAAADARQHAERLNTISRDKSRKDDEAGSGMGGSAIKIKTSSDVLQDAWFQSAGSFGGYRMYADSTAYGEDESPLRGEAWSERHQRTVERAVFSKTLAEKNLRDVLAQREQAEKNRLAELLDADVGRWSAGKQGNLRALLSTLQYILGPESGWQSIPLTDVITAAAVKKAYRKATLFVHPDKLQQRGASIQQKYICEKVFDLLKEAWNKFNSEE